MTSRVIAVRLDHSRFEVAQQIWDLMQRSYRVEAELIAADDFPPLRRSVKNIQASAASFVAVTEAGLPIAVAELGTWEGAAGEGKPLAVYLSIESFVVSPDRFRQGVGAALLQAILAREASGRVVVDTALSNRPGISFYQSNGFVQVSEYENRDGFRMSRLMLTGPIGIDKSRNSTP